MLSHKKDTLNCVKVLSPLARGDTPSVVANFGTNQKFIKKGYNSETAGGGMSQTQGNVAPHSP